MKLTRDALNAVQAHGEEGYPHEICGVLVGPKGAPRATEARRARNTVSDRAHDRYEIDPLDHIRIQRECDETGLEIVGYYHSHPDHPARPSVFDSERSWAGVIYLIVAIEKGRLVDANAFATDRDGGPLEPAALEID